MVETISFICGGSLMLVLAYGIERLFSRLINFLLYGDGAGPCKSSPWTMDSGSCSPHP